MKGKISFTALAAIAIALISMGMKMIDSGEKLYGIMTAAIGVVLLAIAGWLFEKGIIRKLQKADNQ